MSKYSCILVLTVLGTIGQVAAAEVSVLPDQAVHEQNKADTPLLSEMQAEVRLTTAEWLARTLQVPVEVFLREIAGREVRYA